MITKSEWEEILIQKKREWETLQTLKSEVLNRIFEISWVGDHTVTLYGKLPENALELVPLGWQVISACPCGNYGHPESDCLCGHESVRNWRNSKTWQKYMKADLIMEWPVHPSSTWKSEEFEGVAERVKRAKEFCGIRGTRPKRIFIEGVKFQDELRKKQILGADREVSFGYVSDTISDLDQKEFVEIIHLAEAVQYQGREL